MATNRQTHTAVIAKNQQVCHGKISHDNLFGKYCWHGNSPSNYGCHGNLPSEYGCHSN